MTPPADPRREPARAAAGGAAAAAAAAAAPGRAGPGRSGAVALGRAAQVGPQPPDKVSSPAGGGWLLARWDPASVDARDAAPPPRSWL
ncbi:unnamed protein product, partial [Bubo scandiacus]